MQRIIHLVKFYGRRFRAFLGRGIVVERETIVINDEKERCKNPLFIIGVHRSGTSLLRRVLNSHPEIACPPESFFFQNYTGIIENELTFVGLNNLGFNKDQALRGLSHSAAYFHESFRRAKKKRRWADKTPQNVFHLHTLKVLFPQAQYIVILRNPLDIAFSIWNRKWEMGFEGSDLLERTCNYINEATSKVYEFTSGNKSSCHVLKYEDLVTNPESEIRKMCNFMGEEFSHDMLEYHKQSHGLGTEDPISRGARGFQLSSENWRSLPENKISRFSEMLNESFKRYGYEKPQIN